MSETDIDRACNDCGASEWKEILNDEYGGHKGGSSRSDTKREVVLCENCGSEGRRFTDGVDGTATHAGALRNGSVS